MTSASSPRTSETTLDGGVGAQPRYVTSIDAPANFVRVADARALDRRVVVADAWNAVSAEIPAAGRTCAGWAKVRRNHAPQRAEARAIEPPSWLWPRTPPIRYRKTVPDSWFELTIREGRNRQVRRMMAAVGLPTLRLIRVSIGPYTLGNLAPGTWREIEVRR